MVALVGGLTGFALVSVLNQSWGSFQRAVMAAALCVVVFAMIHVFGCMGMGHVKYASVIGLYLGWISWESVYWGVFAAFLLAALAVFICSICRRPQRNIPFGPFMTLGVIYMSAISVI
jgi:leader peptidase (prepilin peptidase)/N-methyltransferase